MSRRFYRRRYYRRNYYSGNSGSGLIILLYLIFWPIVLLYFLIMLIVKISKKNKLNQTSIDDEDSIYQDNEPQISFYRDDSNVIVRDLTGQTAIQPVYQQKESLITDYEKYFYNILEDNFGQDYKIQTQVNLASIVKKVNNSKYQNELFRNIDFGIFEKTSLKPLLMIEINDSTHKNINRYQRDLNVRKILEESNIKLITFYSGYENKRDYVVSRITSELQEFKKTTF